MAGELVLAFVLGWIASMGPTSLSPGSVQGGPQSLEPKPPSLSQESLEQAKQEAFDLMGLSPEERERMGEIEVILIDDPDQSMAGYYNPNDGRIYINLRMLNGLAEGNASVLRALIALVLSHEYYHVPGPDSGGPGLPGGGIAGGTGGGDGSDCDCGHVGLQYWQMLNACQMALAAAQAGDGEALDSLCQVAERLHRSLTDPDNPTYGGCAEHCSGGSEYENGEVGPPAFGYSYPLQPCEYCPFSPFD